VPPAARRLASGPCTGAGVLVAVGVVLALAGCGSEDDGGSPSTGATPDRSLQITLDRGDGTEPEAYALDCDGDGGDHPDPAAACAQLEAMDDPFAALPDDVVCTEQFGGPETASITGRWDGEPVDLALSRTDGCRIAQWDALGPVLPVA